MASAVETVKAERNRSKAEGNSNYKLPVEQSDEYLAFVKQRAEADIPFRKALLSIIEQDKISQLASMVEKAVDPVVKAKAQARYDAEVAKFLDL
mmetsp:Transcript_88826/g.236478  ORF Transcript_88826/g.236478 Transcript_88826/m.236478 type:complete len:94 (-) Transcript_88826:1620-1901(-)